MNCLKPITLFICVCLLGNLYGQIESQSKKQEQKELEKKSKSKKDDKNTSEEDDDVFIEIDDSLEWSGIIGLEILSGANILYQVGEEGGFSGYTPGEIAKWSTHYQLTYTTRLLPQFHLKFGLGYYPSMVDGDTTYTGDTAYTYMRRYERIGVPINFSWCTPGQHQLVLDMGIRPTVFFKSTLTESESITGSFSSEKSSRTEGLNSFQLYVNAAVSYRYMSEGGFCLSVGGFMAYNTSNSFASVDYRENFLNLGVRFGMGYAF